MRAKIRRGDICASLTPMNGHADKQHAQVERKMVADHRQWPSKMKHARIIAAHRHHLESPRAALLQFTHIYTVTLVHNCTFRIVLTKRQGRPEICQS